MSELVLRELDLCGSPATAARVCAIVGSELGGVRSVKDIATTIDFTSGTTRLLGGYVGNEMVCLNAFMRMGFSIGTTRLFGYQSGFSATVKDHRGKGYWPTIMRAAEEYLAAHDGSFIFGFPNRVSHPLFERKLNYTTLSLYNIRIACFPFIDAVGFQHQTADSESGDRRLSPDLHDNAGWKHRSDTDQAVFEYCNEESFLWGKVRMANKFGVPVRFLEIGGFRLAHGSDLRRFFCAAAKCAGVRFLYVSMNSDNQYFRHLKFREYGQPLILKPIGGFLTEDLKIDVFGGMRDTF